MQEVATDMTDAGVDPGLRFPPVLAELHLAAHGLPGTTQPVLVPPEAVERGNERAPSESVANRATPLSMPAAPPFGMGCSTSRSVWIDTNHLPQDALFASSCGGAPISLVRQYMGHAPTKRGHCGPHGLLSTAQNVEQQQIPH